MYAMRPCRAAIVVALTIACLPVWGAEWTVHPSIGVRQTYSDNLTLAPASSARSDWVTELIPAISLNGVGRRLKIDVEYAMHYLDYRNSAPSSRRLHEAHAAATGELSEDLLFLDLGANISQQRVSSFGPQSTDLVYLTGNRAEVRTYTVSPYLRHRFDDVASAELRYAIQQGHTSDAVQVDTDSRRLVSSINSGPRFQRWGWKILVDHQQIDYSNAPPVELARYTGTLRYALTSQLMLNATAGYEDNTYLTIGGTPRGSLWSAGFHWAPSELTSVAANVGQRYFGNTLDLTAHHRARRTVWSLSYNKDVVTDFAQPTAGAHSTASFLDQLFKNSIPDDVARKSMVDAVMRNGRLPTALAGGIHGLSNRVYLQQHLPLSVAINSAKNTLVLRLFGLRREPLSAATGAPAGAEDDNLQLGGSAAWDWRITPRSDFIIGADYARVRSFVVERTDHHRSFRAALATRLTPKTTATMELRRQERASTQRDAAYEENAVSFFIVVQF